MNKDTIIGFVLIALVLIGFSWWNQPSAEEIEAARKQDSIAAAIKDNAAKQQQADEAARKAQAEAAAKGRARRGRIREENWKDGAPAEGARRAVLRPCQGQ